MQDIDELQSDVKDANKQISDSLDRLLVLCDSVLESLKRINQKIDKY